MGSKTLRLIALSALNNVGDESAGQWEEWTGKAFHIRRRLTVEEQKSIGPAIDIRGTSEAAYRLHAVSIACPELPAAWIFAELETSSGSHLEERG